MSDYLSKFSVIIERKENNRFFTMIVDTPTLLLEGPDHKGAVREVLRTFKPLMVAGDKMTFSVVTGTYLYSHGIITSHGDNTFTERFTGDYNV